MTTQIASEIKDNNVLVYNGGSYKQLSTIVACLSNYDVIFWFAETEDNSFMHGASIKEYAPKSILISSVQNENKKYSLEDLLQTVLSTKSNLCFELTQKDTLTIKVFDPLGCVWYEGTNLSTAVQSTLNRAKFLMSLTRKPSVPVSEDLEQSIEFTADDMQFMKFVKSSATRFHELMYAPICQKDIRGLQFRTPTRCMSGFPSIRKDNLVLISRRNVDKSGITENDFVPCILKGENVEYFGNNKPSIDSPIQTRLFKALPNIDYILHGHVYIKNAPITDVVYPCGALEEVDEILKKADTSSDFVTINLRGHGCLVMTSKEKLKKLRKIQYIVRPIPEHMRGNE